MTDYRELVISDLADTEAKLLEANRQLIDLLVDVCHDLEMWKAFAAQQYHARLKAEQQRDRLRDEYRAFREHLLRTDAA